MIPKHTTNINGPCFIDRLPPEVASTICSYLPDSTSDIANVRLVSTFWNNVATPSLLPTVHLTFNPASFEQLTAISRHPVISQHVTHLFYESDVLDRYESQDNWERNLVSERNRVKSPINSGEGDREYLVYQREFVKIDRPRHQLPREAMDRCYAQYQRLFTLQEQLRDQDYGTSIISEALSHLPKLTSISTSFTPCPHECYRYLVGQFRLCLQRPFGDLGHGQPRGTSQLRSLLLGYGQPRGTSQLRSLLLGYYNAGTQLTRLELGDINWQFLRNESEENMRMMKQSLRHLRELDLNLTTEYDVYDDEIGMEISECREYLTNNALYDFIKAAPMLEDLSISFQHNYPMGCTTELKHIVSDHHWTNLRRANFENILATQADFANFCSHHASTLRHLRLRNIELLHPGKWIPTLENMQKTLNLDTAEFGERLYCDDPPQNWPLDVRCYQNRYDSQGDRTRDALSKYLVYGGTCPLLDEEKHPNQARV